MNIAGINPSDYGLTNIEAQQARESLENEIKKTDGFKEALESAYQSGDDAKLVSACKDFESYFIQMMYKEMRKTVGRDANSLVPKTSAEDYFQDMLDEEYSKAATNSGGIGLAKFLYNQLSGQYQLPPVSPFANQEQSQTSAQELTKE